MEQGGEPRVADFIHGSDGLGNVFLPSPKSKKIEKTASEFLVDMVSEHPGEVSILALGPLTNLALVSFIKPSHFFHSQYAIFAFSVIFSLIMPSKGTHPSQARSKE